MSRLLRSSNLAKVSTSEPLFPDGTSDPTRRVNGTAIVKGDFYFNTSSNRVRIYDGTDWLYVSPEFSKGGEISQHTSGSTSYRVHTFLSTGIFTVTAALTSVDILVVGGGGGGNGGAGGAGQVRTHTGQTIAVGDHTVTIAATSAYGVTGGSSQFGSLAAAVGGGRGGGANEQGQGGASGGGGGWGCAGGAHIGGTATPPGAGYNGHGGDGGCPAPHYLGAGGGAGQAGQGYGNSYGGAGVSNTYRDGTSIYYGGGGGGGTYYTGYTPGPGGNGGGGAGGFNHPPGVAWGTPGTPNTGGGGGSSVTLGGSGIVVVRINQPSWSGG